MLNVKKRTSSTRTTIPHTIETSRLFLRCALPHDGAAVNAAIRETWNDLNRWMDWAQELPTIEQSEAKSREAHANFLSGEDFHLRGFLRNEPTTFVLATRLQPRDRSVPCLEIGYWCRASMQGRGFVGEAVRALCETAFETTNVERLEIRCDERNVASIRVAQHCGFVQEAHLRRHQRAPDGTPNGTPNGTSRGTLIFARLRNPI